MIEIELLGADKCEHDLHGIAVRLEDPNPIMARQIVTLAAAEAGVFAELGGRYVDTGETMRSLTLPEGPHAIRRVAHGALEFGTDVRYARYLTEHIGPATDAGGAKRPPPVAVLKLTPFTRQQIAHDVMDQVVGHGGASGLGTSLIGGML
jgi:hypothetical protein